MKKIYPILPAFIFLLGAPGLNLRGQTGFSPEAYIDFRKDHMDYTGTQMVADHMPVTTYYSSRQYPANLWSVPWFDSVNRVFHLTADELEFLEQNHFMVTERIYDLTWANALADIYINDLPVFLSTDFFLNTLHQSYDLVLQTIEWQFLETNLKELLQAMYDFFPSVADKYKSDNRFLPSLADADLYISVALSLLEDEVVPPRYDNREQYDAVREAIAAEKMTTMRLFTETRYRNLDFSQFTLRGHYDEEIFTPDGIRTLKNYFKAMMWLGRIDFLLTAPPADGEPPWTEEELRRMQLGALLVNETLYGCGKLENLEKHEAIISAMVGPDDNLTPEELKTLSGEELASWDQLFQHDTYEAFKGKLNASDDYGQKIMSNFFFVDPLTSSPDQLPVSYKLLGQKFLVDSYVFSEVVFDRIIFQGEKIWRPLPDPLDVMGALGNDDALALLESEMDQYKYAANLAGLRYLIDSYDEDFWEQSLYNSWLGALREINPVASSAGLPYFMQTAAWHHEKLNTQLASWAQLRHDNLLYGKQSYTGGVSCSFPFTYLEPYPGFYGKLADFAAGAAALFQQVLSGEMLPSGERIITYYETYSGIMERLKTVAEKERVQTALTEDDITFLKTMMNVELGGGCAPVPSITGWFNDLYFNPMKAMEADFSVADVHTQPTDRSGTPVGNVLHVGNGLINIGIFLADNPCNPGQLTTFVGPVASFHQQVQPKFNRLTDEEWANQFYEEELPARPDWVAAYLLDREGKKYPDGRMLKGAVYTGTGEGPGLNIRTIDYLIVYPNPATHEASLNLVLNASCDLQIEIFDSSGRSLYRDIKKNLPPAEHHLSLPVESLKSGLYLLKLTAGNQSLVREVMIR